MMGLPSTTRNCVPQTHGQTQQQDRQWADWLTGGQALARSLGRASTTHLGEVPGDSGDEPTRLLLQVDVHGVRVAAIHVNPDNTGAVPHQDGSG